MFLRELKIRGKGKQYSYWRIIETYWDKERKQTRYGTILNSGELKEEQVNQIKAILSLKKLGPDVVNPTRIYRTLNKLLLKEKEIQNHLAKKIKELGFGDLSLVFYDITSSYFEEVIHLGGW